MNRMLTDRAGTDAAFMVDAFDGKEPPATPQALGSYFTHELRAELLRRGFSDLSRWDWPIFIATGALILIPVALWKAAQDMPGTVLACLFGG
jgi:hypothetical protein